jgi:MFS family permease
LSDDGYWLLLVQSLDGVGAGIYGALLPIIVADLMQGTGRYNVALGAVITAQGLGAAGSTTIGGLVATGAGYDAAFLTLAAIAAIGLLCFALWMPETGPSKRGRAVLKQKAAAAV